LRRTTRELGVDPDVVALLLLFSEATRWLRIVDVAELLGIDNGTASRLAERFDPSHANWGWRAGVRAGMWPPV
jgi:hypothetical protein